MTKQHLSKQRPAAQSQWHEHHSANPRCKSLEPGYSAAACNCGGDESMRAARVKERIAERSCSHCGRAATCIVVDREGNSARYCSGCAPDGQRSWL